MISKKYHQRWLFSVIVILAVTAESAQLNEQRDALPSLTGGSFSGSQKLRQMRMNQFAMRGEGIYRLNTNQILKPLAIEGLNVSADELEGYEITVPKGETIRIDAIQDHPEYGPKYGKVARVTMVVNPDETDVAEKVYISMQDLLEMPLEFVTEGDDATLAELYSPFEESQVAGQGRSKRRTRKGGVLRCYANVKDFLLNKGKLKFRPGGGSAWMASYELPKQGFSRTGSGPGSAQIGDVCVYRGGWHGHGHVEIRVSGGWWYGYGVKSYAITNRTFIGCFRK